MLPPIFDNYFTYNMSVYDHSTRHCLNLHLPHFRTNLRANSIRICGVKVWNALDYSVKSKMSIYSFKKQLKTSLINLY